MDTLTVMTQKTAAATTTADEPPTSRGAQTKRAILAAAMRLFRETGYEQTTMRAIAREAGVSVGNAYYYYASKEQLIQAFYDDVQAEHRRAAAPALASTTDFATRLAATLHAGIDVLSPSHEFAATFFKTAAEPSSPMSPFSADSSPSRQASIALFGEVLAGSSLKVDKDLRTDVPELLWLTYLGVILYWVHDSSARQQKSRLLIDRAVPMIEQLLSLSRLRVLRPATKDVLELLATLRD